jgi:hypothetical protein
MKVIVFAFGRVGRDRARFPVDHLAYVQVQNAQSYYAYFSNLLDTIFSIQCFALGG